MPAQMPFAEDQDMIQAITPKCSIRRSTYGFCFCGLLIAEASRRAAGFRDTNDTKSMTGDIVAIQRGRIVAKLP